MKAYTKLFLAAVLLPLVLSAQSGLFMSFKTGAPISGSMVGLKLGPLAPFGGLDIVRLSGKFEEDYASWDADYWYDPYTGESGYTDLYKDYERTSTFEGSALLFMPHAGARFYLSKFYLVGDLMMVIPSVQGVDKGERRYYNINGYVYDVEHWDDELEEEDREDIHDALNFVVLSAGFGAEYAFSEHFSVGGEYGLRIAANNIESDGEDVDDYEPITWREEWKQKVSMALGVTYTCFTFNFYW